MTTLTLDDDLLARLRAAAAGGAAVTLVGEKGRTPPIAVTDAGIDPTSPEAQLERLERVETWFRENPPDPDDELWADWEEHFRVAREGILNPGPVRPLEDFLEDLRREAAERDCRTEGAEEGQ